MAEAAGGHGRGDGAEPAGEATLAIERRVGLRGVRRFSHDAMATVFEVYAVHDDAGYVAQAAQAAFDLVDRLEGELSRFRPNSDISRINHLAAGEQVRVGPASIECLVIARHMFEVTGGAFDVSIGTGLTSFELDPEEFTVRATRTGVQVDLGGVGKGYAVDLMAELIEEWGLGVALVHGGFSSVLALEPPEGTDGWPLTLSDPGNPSRVLTRLSVRHTALSASGLRKGDHIVDPRTGGPVRGCAAAWAAARRPEPGRDGVPAQEPIRVAAVADALTTAFMLLDVDEIRTLCERTPGLEAWILPARDAGARDADDLLHFGDRMN